MLERLKQEARRVGKPEWRPMLVYVADLHERSVREPVAPFALPWEEIGPGYFASPAFGHWDIVHQILDVLPSEPEHAKNQIANDLANQEPDGLVPGSIWMKGEKPRWSTTAGHPPMWPVAVQDYYELTGDREFVGCCFEPLVRQIRWFEEKRKAEGTGFYYTDILTRAWESGVDEGVRFDDVPIGKLACVDATAHVDMLYQYGSVWAKLLGEDACDFDAKDAELRRFMREELFDEQTGFFHDIWAVGNPHYRRLTY